MTNFEPIQIAGETFDPQPTDCPACGAEIDAQRALYEGACPECNTAVKELLADNRGDTPDEYEPESYKPEAVIDA
jgi:Zn finger protein HypA/HybF involved in hydrogenase expression